MGINLSYTANTKYQVSPRAWYLHYMLRIREANVGSALFLGSAVDDGANQMLENKMLGKVVKDPIKVFEESMEHFNYNDEKIPLRSSDKIKYYKSDLDKSIWTEEDHEIKDASDEWITLRRKGIMMLEAFKVQVMPHIKEVISIQDFVKIPNGQGDHIIGYIDFVAKFKLDESVLGLYDKDPKLKEEILALKQYDDSIIIFDNKTSSKKYAQNAVEESGQLATYASFPSNKFHHDYEGFIVMPKKFRSKKTPHVPIQIMIGHVDEEVMNNQFEQYESTLHGIKHGIFPCNEENCAKNPFGCPYKNYCKDGSLEGLVDLGMKK